MANSFTAAEKVLVNKAINLMLIAQARETPFDAGVIDALSASAVSCGFATSSGKFHEDCLNNPITTLLRWVVFMGS
jgi:hypothetical protein